ncbi:NADP-dependent oxidoreductase [Paenibacillus allorhizosphaerae]|uniref:Quinone oxidoreductase 1 n=1 Tax=Paenibacillus allorhizosphaerae TaxID=2849866 RepID=A0ABM8VTQ3_9BACL|nr:NADP-dependent oxidoreductase [Paenibacillus allorhizosphaerae]CAG7658121.1 Quinone oxidoreductase 1 [Paenibacillus allorhizosphaerae]
MSNALMKAVRVHEYGGPNVLQIEKVERPHPVAGEVLVRIVYAAVIPLDWRIRKGLMKQINPVTFPYTPGIAASGIVESVGAGVTEFRAGDRVFGALNGAYAEYGIVAIQNKANPNRFLAHMSENMTFESAAAIWGGVDTAWKALFSEGELEAGQTVLIHAAAGGVGQFAVQLAKWRGATVIGTASTANLDFVKSLGADQVIDYTATPFEKTVNNVDLVVDCVGGDTQSRSWSVLKRGGILVALAGPPSLEKAKEYGVTAKFNTKIPTYENRLTIAQFIAEGTIKPAIDHIYPLGEVNRAHEKSEARHGRGRILLSVNSI